MEYLGQPFSGSEHNDKSENESENLDPSSLKHDMKKLRELHLRKEVEWLEVESRNKFSQFLMKTPVLPKSGSVSQHVAATAKIDAAKARSKFLVARVDKLNERRGKEIRKTSTLRRKNQMAKAKLENAQTEVIFLQEKYNMVCKNSGKEKEKALADFKEMTGWKNAEPEKAIKIAEKVLQKNEKTLKKLSNDANRLTSQISQYDKKLVKLNSKLQQLHREQKSQIYGGSEQTEIKRLDELLESFVPMSVRIAHEEDSIVVVYGSNEIVFDKNLKILSVSDKSINPERLANINNDTGEFKHFQLSRFLIDIISRDFISS